MAKYAIGTIIYENRVRRKITQEELSYGICTPATLSKIENGVQVPRRKIFEALMQRLGLQTQLCFLPVSNEELERSNLEYNITRKLSLSEYDIASFLERYQKCGAELDHMEKQFYLYARGCVLMNEAHKPAEALKLFLAAIQCTLPDFAHDKLMRGKLLTFDEIRIINCLSIIYCRIGEIDRGTKIMFFLKEYMDRADIDMEEKAKLYPMILFNLSNWVGRDGRNELVFELCNEGLEFCIKNGKLSVFPYLIFNKAYSLARMNRIDEAIPLFRQACTIFEAVKDNERAQVCRKEVFASFAVRL